MAIHYTLAPNQHRFLLLQGAVVLLLGSKESVPEVPATPVKFIEDMNEAEAATAVGIVPGLRQL